MMNNNKLMEIKRKLLEDNIDILGVTEIWMREDINSAEVSIPGYIMFRKDRDFKDKTKGGGVLLYIKIFLNAVEICENKDTESVWIDLHITEKTRITIGVCYRSPSISSENEKILFDTIKIMTKKPCM